MLENFHDEKGEERFVVNLLGSYGPGQKVSICHSSKAFDGTRKTIIRLIFQLAHLMMNRFCFKSFSYRRDARIISALYESIFIIITFAPDVVLHDKFHQMEQNMIRNRRMEAELGYQK